MFQQQSCYDSELAKCPETAPAVAEEREFVPSVDIVETDDAVLLTADMPGVDENSAAVSLDRNILTIRGTAKPPAFDGYSLAYAEYEDGPFAREFTVSSEVDRSGLQATMKNGVLRVRLPKAHQALAQKVAITAG
jgi:HSP20 family protein